MGRSGGLFVYLTCQQHDGTSTAKPRLHGAGDTLPCRGAMEEALVPSGPITHSRMTSAESLAPRASHLQTSDDKISLLELSGDFSKFTRVKSLL